jgi:hypothetical protein
VSGKELKIFYKPDGSILAVTGSLGERVSIVLTKVNLEPVTPFTRLLAAANRLASNGKHIRRIKEWPSDVDVVSSLQSTSEAELLKS